MGKSVHADGSPLSVNEREFILSSLKEGLRSDGRPLIRRRPVSFAFHSLGTVECTLGRTRVLASVTSQPVQPHHDRPAEGFVHFFAEFSQMGSLGWESGRGPTEEEVEVTRTLEKLFKSSRAIDTEGLCIVAGKLVWSIRTDVNVLDDDGNILDCCCLATLVALMHFRRPDVTVTGEDIQIHSMDQKNPVPLSIHHYPLSVSFSLFHNGDVHVMDPTLSEEIVHSGSISIGINNNRELCTLAKNGGAAIEMQKVLYFCDVAFAQIQELLQLIHDCIKKDFAKRNLKENSFREKSK